MNWTNSSKSFKSCQQQKSNSESGRCQAGRLPCIWTSTRLCGIPRRSNSRDGSTWGIYLKSNPRTIQDREDNAEKIRIAEGIRATREISILNHQFGFIDRSTPKMDFLAWYRSQVEKNNKNWAFAYNDFYQYVDGHCTMGDITLELCKGFREYLLSAKLIKNEKKQLNQNSASGYWSTFRALLAIAYREHLIKENVNDYLEAISDVETRREYLTLEELRDLADTPCANLDTNMEGATEDLTLYR